MTRKRRSFTASFKARVALAAERGDKTTAELAAKFAVHPSQVTSWKKQLLEGVAELFQDGPGSTKGGDPSVQEQELFEQIGRLKMELEWQTQNLPSSVEEKRKWIVHDQPGVSVARQCELLDLARSTCYYEAMSESAENLALMRDIDEIYLKYPFFGSRKIAMELNCNRKRILRLMRCMGLQAIYRKPVNVRRIEYLPSAVA